MNVRSTTQLPIETDADTIAVGVFEDEGIAHDVDGDPGRLDTLLVSAHDDVGDAVHAAQVGADAANAARDLQNTPANDLTPTHLAEAARAIADSHSALTCEVWGRREIEEAGMGAFAAVARGSDEEPALITLRYEPRADRRSTRLNSSHRCIPYAAFVLENEHDAEAGRGSEVE